MFEKYLYDLQKLRIFAIEIDNQQLSIMIDFDRYIGKTKGVFTIKRVVTPTDNLKTTIVECSCSRCGKLSDIKLYRFSDNSLNAKYCKHCKDEYSLEVFKEKYVGMTNGVYTCIDVIRSRDCTPARLFAKVRCSVCGKESLVRLERIYSKSYEPQSCEHCVNELYRIRNIERYHRIYGANTKEEYEYKHFIPKRLQSYKANAQSRNLEFNLTDEQFENLITQECYYCGKEFAKGIDRKDSKDGYFIENCVPCCMVCNRMKNKFSIEEFFEQVKLIYQKHINNESSSTISEESTLQANGSGNGGNPMM